MTVQELIELLKKYPSNSKVYRDGGEYKDNYIPIRSIVEFRSWGTSGLEIK